MFFVEAEKPSVDIKNDIGPAYQVRRYGYTAKVPLSVEEDLDNWLTSHDQTSRSISAVKD